MVKLYPVRTTSSIHCSDKSTSGDDIEIVGKKPNRFAQEMYDRSVFGENDCRKATSQCNCTLCSENPLVVISGESLFAENNITLKNIKEFIEGGVLQNLIEESFVIYSQVCSKGKEQIGLLVAIDVADCKNNTLKSHEQVTKNVQTICFDKFSSKSSIVDPLMVMYRSREAINKIISNVITSSPPNVHWVDELETHRLWIVDQPDDILCIKKAFSSVESVYIADGHHRTASACILSESPIVNRKSPNYVQSSKYLTALLYPHDQLEVISYNRCITSLNNMSSEEFLRRVCDTFEVTLRSLSSSNEQLSSIGMYLNKVWYNLKLLDSFKPDHFNPLSTIDAQILNDKLFDPILNVNDDNSVIYVNGSEGISKLQDIVDSGKAAVAFCVRGVPVESIMDIADAGLLLPAKATYFSPKPRVGLISRLQR